MSGAIATAAIIGGIGAAGSIGGAAIASSGAKSAAKTQANSADQAAQLQYQASQNALDFQKQQWNQTQQNAAPWLQYGGGALSNLGYLMGINPNMSLGVPSGQNPVQHSLGGSVGGTGLPAGGGPAPIAGGGSTVGGATGGAGNFGRPSAMGAPVASPAGSVPSLNGMTGAGGGIPSANPALGISATGGPGMSVGTFPGDTGGQLGVGGGAGSVPRATGSAAMPVGSLGGISGIPQGAIGATGDTGLSGPTPSGGFGSLMTPYSGHFEAPTDITMQNDPGYQARMNLGTDAIQRSAAARGGVLTGGTARDLNQFAQDYASNEYGNVYNRALTGFQTNYNQYNNDQANEFNRLAAIAGVGQTASGQLAAAGQAASNNVSSNLLGTATNMGNAYQNAGNANASGILNSSGAWGSAVGGIGGNLSNLYMLNQLKGLQGGGSGGYGAVGSAGPQDYLGQWA